MDSSFKESEAKGEQSERAEAGRVWYLMAHRRSCGLLIGMIQDKKM